MIKQMPMPNYPHRPSAEKLLQNFPHNLMAITEEAAEVPGTSFKEEDFKLAEKLGEIRTLLYGLNGKAVPSDSLALSREKAIETIDEIIPQLKEKAEQMNNFIDELEKLKESL